MKTVRHIALIDDNTPMNTIHGELFRIHGFRGKISLCHNTTEALKLLTLKVNDPPQLIFLDLNMPGANGWDFLEVLKELPNEAVLKIPIIVLTSSSNPEDAERSTHYDNVKGYLTKPLAFAELDRILRNLDDH